MKIIKSVREMAAFSRDVRRRNRTIGLVPTMGYLHEGHLSLMKAARRQTDVVVVSIFVNPLQFGPHEDFRQYPRDFRRDRAMAQSVGVDVVFCPSQKDMYPDGYRTFVTVDKLTDGLCGASRPGHFKGVTTVVAKFFGIVKPDKAYFGQKDAQQAIVIKRMTENLNMGIDIRVMPIIREKDGLAMSSRNVRLSAAERRDAPILYQSLVKARRMVKGGETDPSKVIRRICFLIEGKRSARIDYVAVVDARDLSPLRSIDEAVLIAVAAYFGKTRLIDNIVIREDKRHN